MRAKSKRKSVNGNAGIVSLAIYKRGLAINKFLGMEFWAFLALNSRHRQVANQTLSFLAVKNCHFLSLSLQSQSLYDMWLPVRFCTWMVCTLYANPVIFAIACPCNLTAFPPLCTAWWSTLPAFMFIVCMFTWIVLAEARVSRIRSHGDDIYFCRGNSLLSWSWSRQSSNSVRKVRCKSIEQTLTHLCAKQLGRSLLTGHTSTLSLKVLNQATPSVLSNRQPPRWLDLNVIKHLPNLLMVVGFSARCCLLGRPTLLVGFLVPVKGNPAGGLHRYIDIFYFKYR